MPNKVLLFPKFTYRRENKFYTVDNFEQLFLKAKFIL